MSERKTLDDFDSLHKALFYKKYEFNFDDVLIMTALFYALGSLMGLGSPVHVIGLFSLMYLLEIGHLWIKSNGGIQFKDKKGE